MLIKKIRGGFKLPVPPSFLLPPFLQPLPPQRAGFKATLRCRSTASASTDRIAKGEEGEQRGLIWTADVDVMYPLVSPQPSPHSVPDFPGGHGSVASLFLSNRTTTPPASWAKTPGCSAADLTPLTSLLRCACHPWRDSGRELPGGDQSHVPDCPRGPSRPFVLQIAPDWEFRQCFLISVLLLPSFQPASERQGSPSLCWVCQ